MSHRTIHTDIEHNIPILKVRTFPKCYRKTDIKIGHLTVQMLQKTRLIFYRQTFFSALYEKAANFDLRLSKESLTQKRNPNDVTFIYHHLGDSPKTLVKVFPLKKKKTLTLCEKVSRHLLPFSSSSFTSLVSVISISLSSTIFTPSAATGRPSFTAFCLKSQTLYRKPNRTELEFTY